MGQLLLAVFIKRTSTWTNGWYFAQYKWWGWGFHQSYARRGWAQNVVLLISLFSSHQHYMWLYHVMRSVCPLLGMCGRMPSAAWLVLKEQFHFLVVVLCFTSGGNKQRQMQGVQVHTGTKTITMETRIQVCARACVCVRAETCLHLASSIHACPSMANWCCVTKDQERIKEGVSGRNLSAVCNPAPSSLLCQSSRAPSTAWPALALPGPDTHLAWFEPWRAFSACSVIMQSWALITPPVGRLIRNTWPQPGGAGLSWCLRRLRHE